MKNHKGQVATILTLGLVVVGSLLTLGSSLFISKNKVTTNSMAAEIICPTGSEIVSGGTSETGSSKCGSYYVSGTTQTVNGSYNFCCKNGWLKIEPEVSNTPVAGSCGKVDLKSLQNACCFTQKNSTCNTYERVYAHKAARISGSLGTACSVACYGTAYNATGWYECPDTTVDSCIDSNIPTASTNNCIKNNCPNDEKKEYSHISYIKASDNASSVNKYYKSNDCTGLAANEATVLRVYCGITVSAVEPSTGDACEFYKEYSCQSSPNITYKLYKSTSTNNCTTSSLCWGTSQTSCHSTVNDSVTTVCPGMTIQGNLSGKIIFVSFKPDQIDGKYSIGLEDLNYTTNYDGKNSVVTWKYEGILSIGRNYTVTALIINPIGGNKIAGEASMTIKNDTYDYIFEDINLTNTNSDATATSEDNYGCTSTSPNCTDYNSLNRQRKIRCGDCAESYDDLGIYFRCGNNGLYDDGSTENGCTINNSISAASQIKGSSGGGAKVASPVQQTYTVQSTVSVPVYELTGENKGLGFIQLPGLTAVIAL